MALPETATDEEQTMFNKFGGYYSVRFSGIEFARFAPSSVWSEYARSMEGVGDFSYSFVEVDR